MRFCTACGTPVSGTRTYCTHCGAAVRRTPPPELAAAQVGAAPGDQIGAAPGDHIWAAQGDQAQPVNAPLAGPGTAQATAAQATAALPATPEPPSVSLPTTWLADFDQRPEPPAVSEPELRPGAAPASGRTLLAAALVAVVIAAGSAAWMAGSSRPRAGRQPATASGVSPGRSAQRLAPRPAGSPRPSGSIITPIPASRRGIVSVSQALAQRADAQQVAGFLDSYFAAVNHREYLEYSSLFERWHHLTRAEFDRGYRTTHDSSALLVGLSSSQDALTATVTFTSHQAPTASPNHASCTTWRIVLYLRRSGGVYLIAPPPSGYHATYHGCG
jgi:hypothetical protein